MSVKIFNERLSNDPGTRNLPLIRMMAEVGVLFLSEINGNAPDLCRHAGLSFSSYNTSTRNSPKLQHVPNCCSLQHY